MVTKPRGMKTEDDIFTWNTGRYQLLRDRPDDFHKVVRCAMRQDWSWARSAEAYETLYRKLLAT